MYVINPICILFYWLQRHRSITDFFLLLLVQKPLGQGGQYEHNTYANE